MVSRDREHGSSCFVATATSEQALAIEAEGLGNVGLTSFGPFPTVLKIAPGLLDIDQEDDSGDGLSEDAAASGSHRMGSMRRLTAIHGDIARMKNVGGLTVQLSPGVLSASVDFSAVETLTLQLLDGLLASTLDLHAINYWSDHSMTSPQANALRARECSRAADVIHGLSSSAEHGGLTPGDVCAWDSLSIHHTGDDNLLLTG